MIKYLATAALLVFSANTYAATYMPVGAVTRPPFGWVKFCEETPSECAAKSSAQQIVLNQTSWNDLDKVNRWVNDNVKSMTDQDHWGVIEKWSIPTDGYGDCEDYALLKRKLLIDAGWPVGTLLITVVRDLKNEGHAVLTVVTDNGDFILDNMNEKIVAWSDTGYRYIKRQSQTDQNSWVSLIVVAPEATMVSASQPKD